MEKYFGNAYRGDPGVPHSGAERFENIWIGSAAFSVLTWFNPYMWQLSNQYNWHDKAMMFEHYHWKKAMAKNQPYQFKWNQYLDADLRESYYFNWPVYFPLIDIIKTLMVATGSGCISLLGHVRRYSGFCLLLNTLNL